MKTLLIILSLLFFSSLNYAQQIEFKHPKVLDLGKIKQGKEIKGNIQFVNTGKESVELESVKPSCGCTAVTPNKMIFNGGETADIPFTIKTKNFNGVIRKSITLTFKNVEPKRHVIYVQANVVTPMSISPRFVNFQRVKLNSDTTIAEYFEIENQTDDSIEISKIYSNSKFIKISPPSVVIPAHKSHLVRVDLTPSEPGRHNTKIFIQSNNAQETEKTLPIFINVQNAF